MSHGQIKAKFESARRYIAEALAARDDEFHTGIRTAAAIDDLLSELETLSKGLAESFLEIMKTQTSHARTLAANTASIALLTSLCKELGKVSIADKQKIAVLEEKLVQLVEEKFN